MKKLVMIILLTSFVLHAGFVLAISTVHVGEMSSGTFTQSDFLWGDELRAITDTVGMEIVSANLNTEANSVYLILGIAGVSSTSLTISSTSNSSGTVSQGSGALSYALSEVWTETDNTNAYQKIGLGTMPSQNWSNWSGAYATLMGTTPASFGLFAYNLLDTSFDSSPMAINFNHALEAGTFVLGYSTFGNKEYVAPFTETGFVQPPFTSVPEPATFLLLGSGLAGLAFYRRKRK